MASRPSITTARTLDRLGLELKDPGAIGTPSSTGENATECPRLTSETRRPIPSHALAWRLAAVFAHHCRVLELGGRGPTMNAISSIVIRTGWSLGCSSRCRRSGSYFDGIVIVCISAASEICFAARRPGCGLSPKVVGWICEQGAVAGLECLAGRISDTRSAEKVKGFARVIRPTVG